MQTIVELPIVGSTPAVDYPQVVAVKAHQVESAVPDAKLTNIQRESLHTLALFHHATADLILRKLKLSPNSLRHLQKALSDLSPEKKEDRFVEIGAAPKQQASRFGSAPYVYWLGMQGFAYLRAEHVPVGRYRRQDDILHQEEPLRHRFAVNEFYLKALQLEELPGVFLREHKHEKELNGNPLRVTLLTDVGRTQVFDPDWRENPQRVKELITKGWATTRRVSSDLVLDYEIAHPKHRYRFLPEITLSRMWEHDWRLKVRAYLNCIPAYEARYGTKLLTAIPVMVASPSDFPRRDLDTLTPAEIAVRQREAVRRQHRMERLKEWTEKELTKLGFAADADLFLFSCAPLDEISPSDLFFSPHWVLPFDATPRPLMRYKKRGDDGF